MSSDPRDERWRQRADREYSRATYHPWLTATKWLLLVVLVGVVLAGLAGLLSTGSVFFAGQKAKITNPARVQRQVYDPNNTIAQIAFFHNTCNTAAAQQRIVQTNEARYRADQTAAHLSTSPIQQQQAIESLSQDATDVAGAKNALETTVADYNSRSAQSTANVFKDNNLPDRLSATGQINCN